MATELLAMEPGVSVTQTMSSRQVLVIVSGHMMTFGCAALGFSTWGRFQPVVSTVFIVGLLLLVVVFAFGNHLMGKVRTTQDAWS